MTRQLRIGGTCTLLLALVGGGANLLAQPRKGTTAAKAEVRLLAAVDGVTPARPFDVGLQFKLPEDWHIYWQNSGDSGQAPRPRWTLPDGFTAGALQFPVPTRHVSGDAEMPIVTNIIAGEPLLMVRVTPPDSIDASTVTLDLKLRYLMCDELCVIQNERLSLTLPVLAASAEAKVTNEDVFAAARRALPKTTTKYLTVSARTEPSKLVPGQAFELLVDVNIKHGFHIQSNQPTKDYHIPSELFIERSAGAFFESAVYPPGKIRTIKMEGKLSEYAGRIQVRVPGEVDEDVAETPTTFGGIFKFQACNEKGQCFAPTAVAFSTTTAAKPGGGAVGTTPPALTADSQPSTDTLSAADKNASEPAEARSAEPTADADSATALSDEDAITSFLKRFGTLGLLLGCFIYGLFINATPCVLPLISIKVLGFVQQAQESRRRTLMLALSFGAGVIIFFVILGLLAARGKNVLQYPIAVIVLGTVVMALALSMLGVYNLQVPTTATKLDAAIGQEGMGASFGKGALAPVLGFACTGPLMVTAFGWATKQPPQLAVLAFVFMGLGMASPYMILGANPNWLGFLPKPGNWMITFERIMGFLLMGMVVWLIHPLISHLGAEGLEWTLVFLVCVALACWLLGQINFGMSTMQRWRYRGGAVAIVGISAVLIFGVIFPLDQARPGSGIAERSAPDDWSNGIPWQPWSPEAVQSAVEDGRVVFVDFTAAYCTVCKENKALAINRAETLAKMQACGVAVFQGDFTQGDPKIFKVLQAHDRVGVPLDLIYTPGKPNAPIVLQPRLSRSYLLEKLDQACAS